MTTFFLVFAVFGTAVDDRGPFAKTAGLTIGLAFGTAIVFGLLPAWRAGAWRIGAAMLAFAALTAVLELLDLDVAANFTKLGFHPGFGLTETLPAVIGRQNAAMMFYTSRRVTGEGQPVTRSSYRPAFDLSADGRWLVSTVARQGKDTMELWSRSLETGAETMIGEAPSYFAPRLSRRSSSGSGAHSSDSVAQNGANLKSRGITPTTCHDSPPN